MITARLALLLLSGFPSFRFFGNNALRGRQTQAREGFFSPLGCSQVDDNKMGVFVSRNKPSSGIMDAPRPPSTETRS